MSEELFAHVNLNTVDPNASNIPDDIYTYEVSDAGVKTFTYKSGAKAGEEGEYTSFALTIVDSEKLSGRRVWSSLFAGDFTNKKLRKVMDATGVPQTGDFTDWLSELKSERARFKAPYRSYVKKNGEKAADVQFIEAQPA